MTLKIPLSTQAALSDWRNQAPEDESPSRFKAFRRILNAIEYQTIELDLSDLDDLTSLPLPLPIPTLKTLIISRKLLPRMPVDTFLKFPTDYVIIVRDTSQKPKDKKLKDIVLRPVEGWCYRGSDNSHQLFGGID